MPTSTKMAIPYPASTDLVKDGATNMGSMATQIDAKTGLVLISATTFSGVSSQSINDVFSTNYDNYRILFKSITASGAGPVISLRLRLSGTDTSANYGTQRMFAQGASVSANRDAFGTDEIYVVDSTTANPQNACADMIFYSPNKAEVTTYTNIGEALLGATLYMQTSCGFQNSTTQFTGFTVYPGSGNIGGTVSVYGYRN